MNMQNRYMKDNERYATWLATCSEVMRYLLAKEKIGVISKLVVQQSDVTYMQDFEFIHLRIHIYGVKKRTFQEVFIPELKRLVEYPKSLECRYLTNTNSDRPSYASVFVRE